MVDILSVKSLVKSYSSFCLDHVDLVCPEGTIMGLVGPNGAGKTTVIQSVLGAILPDDGDVRIFGKPQSELTAEDKERIGVVFDDNCLPEELTAAELNRVFGRLYRRWNEARFHDSLIRMNLPSRKAVRELSRGNRIKMNLAVAMAHEPQLLILDEITGALDPIARDDIMELFLEFIQDEKRSILFSSHITTDLEKTADYITFINAGRILFSREKDELLYGYSILRCRTVDFRNLNPAGIVAFRETPTSVDVIWDHAAGKMPEGAGIIVEKPTIEEIMLIMTKGGTTT